MKTAGSQLRRTLISAMLRGPGAARHAATCPELPLLSSPAGWKRLQPRHWNGREFSFSDSIFLPKSGFPLCRKML
jgi:hypothetical protein